MEMNGYIKAGVCHNISGFMKYCRYGKEKNQKERDDYIEEFSTAPDSRFWSELAKENRTRHKENKHVTNREKKAVEARQLMIKEKYGSEHTCKEVAELLKAKTGTEWIVFKHRKDKNVHFHCIGADRVLLSEPIPEKRAVRTYYYDAQGKKCKKADAVKVVPKGTVLQSAQKFSEKVDELRSKKWLDDFKKTMYDFLNMEEFHANEEFAYSTIGTYNIKSENQEQIEKVKAKNAVLAEINAYFREHKKLKTEFSETIRYFDGHTEQIPKTPKEWFCRHYNIKSFMYGDEKEKMVIAFEKFKMEYPLKKVIIGQRTEKTIQNSPHIAPESKIVEDNNKQYDLDEKTLKNDSERSERVIAESNDYFEDETEKFKEELIGKYQEVQKDINDNFYRFECADHQLDTYACWEQQGKTEWVYKVQPILGTYGFEKPRQDINALIEKYNLTAEQGIKSISDNDTMRKAYSISQAVLNALKSILERIKELFAELTGKDIEPIVKEINEINKEEREFW